MTAKLVYQCPGCERLHDHEDDAIECCSEVWEVWLCEVCGEHHDTKDDASACCEGTEIKCPVCARDYREKDLDGVAIRVAGHCRVCNPHYSYDEQFQIEHHHEADTGRWEGLNT